ncbi:hypothetical protein IWX90DRAFT_312450 [Phyllosticta citrichinensis]|uniref:Uncharacterized protein n=1 Tax=Phyllosticta citrichinensis TaxID=1130410 RepID=A0ABR1XM32_9PEZI
MTQLDSDEMADEKHEGKMESEEEEGNVEPEIVYFANNGDLRLRVFEQTPEARPKIFIVSSHAMSLACHAWNSMLNGHFKESQPATSDKQREVALPDDNPDALKILLNISHLRQLRPHCSASGGGGQGGKINPVSCS